MKTTKTIQLTIFLLFLFIFINSVSALDISTCQDLNNTNTVYDLTANLTAGATCLNITANGVTVDGHGFTIIYSQASAGKGIRSVGYNSTTIKNINLLMNVTSRTGYAHAINLLQANNVLIDNVDIFVDGDDLSTSGNKGMSLTDINNVTINNVNIETDNADGQGISIDTSAGKVSGNIFIYNTFINTTGPGSSSCSCGIRLIASNGNMNTTVLENVTVYTMADTDGNAIEWDPKAGITSHINLTNVYAQSLGDAMMFITGADQCYVKDSTFVAGVGYKDIQLNAGFGSNVYITNTTYNQSRELVSAGKLFRQWYYKVYVNNTGGLPLDNANITAYNVTGAFETNLTTDATGFTPIGSLISYINNAGTTTYQTPHDIYASASGYPAINHAVNITLKENFLTDFFSLDSAPPVINLNYPTNGTFYNYKTNFYFNATATDPNGLSACLLYGDWTGTWHLNKSLTAIFSGVQFYTQQNLTDGTWKYNFWCNDTTNSGTWNSTNVTFIVDTTLPVITDVNITTATGSQTVNFNVTAYTEINCNNSYFSVFNSLGAIENGIENETLTSCTELNDSFVVSGYATYNLTIYMRDKAGNLGTKNTEFTTVAGGGGDLGGGGGASPDKKTKETIPVIGILRTNETLGQYSDIIREIMYAKINSFCSNKETGQLLAIQDYSQTCVLSPIDLEIIRVEIDALGFIVKAEDMEGFFNDYSNRLFFQGYETKETILKYGLFTSVLGIPNPIKINPPSLDRYFVISKVSGNITLEYIFKVNKNIKFCEVVSDTPQMSCEVLTNSSFRVMYYINNTNFLSRIYSGQVAVTSDAEQQFLEVKNVNIVMRTFNISYPMLGIIPAWLGIAIIIVVGILLIVIIRKIRKKRKRRNINT